MPQVSINRRTVLVALAGLVIGAIGVLQFAKLAEDRTLFRPYDFVEYWTAGRLLLDGADPYDPDRLVPMQKAMHDGIIKAVMMWNPPWTLTLVMPFAALPWRLAQFLWLAIQLASLLVSADLLWRMYNGPPRYRWVSWAIALTFAPSLFLLFLGQISGLLLLGVVGFLWCLRQERPIAAGCLAALTAIKPHHLSLFALVLVLEATRGRPIRRTIAAGLAVLLVASAIPLFWNPHVWSDYFAAMRRLPSDTFESMKDFQHSTIGYQLRIFLPGEPFAAMFVPMILAMIGTVFWWRQTRPHWDWERRMPVLVLASVLATPYGAWAFDMVLLLATIIPLATTILTLGGKWLIGLAIGAYLCLNLLLLETIRDAGSQINPWIAPIILIIYMPIVLAGNRAVAKPADRPNGMIPDQKA